MTRIARSTDVRAALRSRQRGMLLNPFRFGGGGGGGGGASYRYWRFNFISGTRSGWAAVLAEIDASFSGTPVSLSGKTYTRQKSGGFGSLEDLFDSSNSTGWGTNATPPEWIQIDCGTPVAIDAFGLTASGSWFDSVAYGPKDFDIQSSSDGSTFTTLTSVVNQSIWALNERRAFGF